MFAATEIIPPDELADRHDRCRALVAEHCPDAGGIMVFNRVNIYYLTGTMGFGAFWLPLDGPPLLMVRKGLERARLESPDMTTIPFRSYADIAPLAQEHSAALPPVVAAEQSSLPWALADMLQRRVSAVRFTSADTALARLRSVKSPWELAKMREAGARHARAMHFLLPERMRPGMSELTIAHLTSEIFFSLGSCGISRMSTYGEEVLLGEVSVGTSGNYPTFYNGPLGCMGMHPAAPFLGNAQVLWEKNTLLSHDAGFCFEGYNSDKTSLYFSGKAQNIPSQAREAHSVCVEIENAIADRMKPGAIPSELYTLSLRMAEQAGFAEGYMGLGGNKVPFLGHGIGLCIDEWPVLAHRFDEPLQKGMTMAVEPKIGLPGIGMVGTENTYEITENGAAALSGGPQDILCLE